MNEKKQIKVTKKDLLLAAEQGLIPLNHVNKLWENLSACKENLKLSKMLQFIYYFGAILIISAMTWFITLGLDWLHGGGLFLISLSYGIVFFTIGYLLWQKEEFKIPGGLFTTVAVCMIPLSIFGLEKYLGIWPTIDSVDYSSYYMWVKRNQFFMEIGTILAGYLALKFVRFPFITAPMALSFWFLCMDITLFFDNESYFAWEQKCWASLVFGLVLLFCSYIIDRKSKSDFAFWGYLFGSLTFWVACSLLAWGLELNWLIYFFISIVLIVSSIFLGRNVLMIFGSLGILNCWAHLAYQVFKDSIIFPFALTFIGIITVCLGILYQKNRIAIKTKIADLTPTSIKKFLLKNKAHDN